MTKMRSKKMTKSTFAIIIMAILMVAMLAFGGTYAYFTAASDAEAGTVTTGTLVVGGDVTLGASANILVPNERVTLPSVEGITVQGTTIAAFRLSFEITSMTKPNPDGEGTVTFTETGDSSLFTLAILDGTDTHEVDANWEKDGDYYYYAKVKLPGESGFTLDEILKELTISLDKTADDDYQGVTVTYSITLEAAQAEWNDKVDPNGELEDGQTISVENAKKLTWSNT